MSIKFSHKTGGHQSGLKPSITLPKRETLVFMNKKRRLDLQRERLGCGRRSWGIDEKKKLREINSEYWTIRVAYLCTVRSTD